MGEVRPSSKPIEEIDVWRHFGHALSLMAQLFDAADAADEDAVCALLAPDPAYYRTHGIVRYLAETLGPRGQWFIEQCPRTVPVKAAGKIATTWHGLVRKLAVDVVSSIHMTVNAADGTYNPWDPRYDPARWNERGDMLRVVHQTENEPRRYARLIIKQLAGTVISDDDRLLIDTGIHMEREHVELTAWRERRARAPNSPKEERDAWMVSEWNKGGKKLSTIRKEANNRWPNDELADDRSARAAMKRYGKRKGIKLRKGNAGRPPDENQKPSAGALPIE